MIGAKNATFKYTPEFMANLLTRLNSTVGKNPAILQPFLKYFSSYAPQAYESSIYTPYAMPRPLPLANDFLLPFSSYCRQPFLHQNDIVYRQVGLSQYQTTNALPAHSLIEHIAQTSVQPVSVQPTQNIGQFPVTLHNIEQHAITTPNNILTSTATSLNPATSKAVSMVEKNHKVISSVPIRIQDLIASLLEQPNNMVLQQQAQPFLQALINQYQSTTAPMQINTEPIYYHIKPAPSTVIEKSVAAASQSFKPYKKTENSFQPIQKPVNDQKTVSIVQQQNQHQMPTVYSSDHVGHIPQLPYYMTGSQQMSLFSSQNPNVQMYSVNAYDPNVQMLSNHFHGLNTF